MGKIDTPSWEKILRGLVDNHWFAITDLFLVIMSAAAWMLIPQYGITFSLFAFLPWALRFLAGHLPFQRTPFDWLIAIFLTSGWISYWVAYDESAAGIKFWLIVSAVLLYYALSAQPKQNLLFVSFLSFCFALTLSFYFCLTYDFSDSGGRFAIWWTNYRPHFDWPAIHYDDVLGLILISAILAYYWLWNTSNKAFGSMAAVMQLLLILGMGMVALVFVLTVSRAITFIALSVVGLWMLWKVSTMPGSNVRVKNLFPVLVLGYLVILIAAAYFGPARDVPGSTHSGYGKNSRAELLGRGAYFLLDYPITGAGLNSFPGLYSQYILVIPFVYFNNSYNLFLDIAIEQGWIGGATFLIICLRAIWLVSNRIVKDPSNELRMVNWLSLLALLVMIVHGLFYDYLYYGNGTALLFFPLGMAITGVVNRNQSKDEVVQFLKGFPRLNMGKIIPPVLALIFILGVNINKFISQWYANLGAVQMSQAELKNFPSNQWATSDMVDRLEPAESTLQDALQYDPRNQTANYRLGLISMLRQDFKTAAANLETAHQEVPNHRGIIKSLGYCYVWLGDMDKAQTLLDQIPEAQNEMKVYIWWWGTQGRPDLSENASLMAFRLDPSSQ